VVVGAALMKEAVKEVGGGEVDRRSIWCI